MDVYFPSAFAPKKTNEKQAIYLIWVGLVTIDGQLCWGS